MEGNDPEDLRGVKSVLQAAHSSGKVEAMVANAFPELDQESIREFIQMPAGNIFQNKKGGKKQEAIDDAWRYHERVVALADEHGEKLRVWCCGGGGDRIVQISMLKGWVDPEKMRPLHGSATPAVWDSLGIRKTPLSLGAAVCSQQNLSMRIREPDELCQRHGHVPRGALARPAARLLVHVRRVPAPRGVELSWGAVESHPEEHRKFLRSLATNIVLTWYRLPR